jgi:DNA-directed RNA polymerase specialized sigma subunit
MRDYSRTELTNAIDEWVLNQKHREILKSRLIDGLTFDALAELYEMSPRQIKRIVYKSQETLFRHL